VPSTTGFLVSLVPHLAAEPSMSGSPFFGLRAILSEEERVPVVFNHAAKGLGHLNPSSTSTDVAEDDEMDMALWLAAALGPSPGPNFVEVRLP